MKFNSCHLHILCLATTVTLAMAFPERTLYNPKELKIGGISRFKIPPKNQSQIKSSVIIRPKIVGGDDAPPGSAPSMVSIQRNDQGPWEHHCGGSIIAPNKVATAAHCLSDVSPGNLRIVAGTQDLSYNEGTVQESSILAAVAHPEFEEDTYNFDYAVLTLAQPLDFNEHVSPISLPPSSAYTPSGDCRSIGWGNTRNDGGVNNPAMLQEVTLNPIPQEDCSELYEEINEITPQMFCAGAPHVGTCKGDSGGPLICGGVLAGLVSWGIDPCAQNEYPSVFANCAEALDFFANN